MDKSGQIINALTFDVEEWYQVTAFEDVYDRAMWASLEQRLDISLKKILAMLERSGVKATFFILGLNVKTRPEIVEMIAAGGHELGTHGMDHQLVYEMTPEAFRADVEESIKVIRDVADVPVSGYRAPSFSITKKSLWALDILRDAGLEYDSSIVPMERSLYGIPDADPFPGPIKTSAGHDIMEFPITTRTVLGRTAPFCGGAYFRLCPLFLMKRWIRAVNDSGHPAIVYLHPWELDPEHPIVPGKQYKSFHYINLKSTEKKLEALLNSFRFATAKEVLEGTSQND